MIKNDFVLVKSIQFNNLRNTIITIEGIKIKFCDLKLFADDKELSLKDYVDLDEKYVYACIMKQNLPSFKYKCQIPNYTKQLKLYCNNELIYKKSVNTLNKFFCLTAQKNNKFFGRIIRLPRIIKKATKLMWSRHHFLVPPRMVKQYIHSFSNNISQKSIAELLYNPENLLDYNKWLLENNHGFIINNLYYNPLISIIIPTYNVSKRLLTECIDSVLNQSYQNFEICIADDNSSLDETLDTLKKYESNNKIHIVYRKKNGHISKASNSALSIANGEFIGLLDNDDILDKNALYFMVKKLNENKKLDLIYSDEDKINFEGHYCMPHFKPDFSLDTLLSVNYICHFTIMRKKIVDELGGFRSEYDGAQDYDLFLRIIDKTKKIEHVPKILYHWRMTDSSTSANANNKNYAILRGKKALEDYFKRNKISARVKILDTINMYQVNYNLDKEPRISIIIPTKDKANILKKCIDSVYDRTNYNNYDIMVVDNNSCDQETIDLLKDYKCKYDNFNYIRLECEFNFSFLNNEACKKCKGEYFLFLNNDTEVITPTWLTDMVGFASQSHIGCVGAKLLYPNRTIQHCGVVTGVGGIAMHVNNQCSEVDSGYFGRCQINYDWSCVTAACLMVKKHKFTEVGGFDEKLKVAFNDVDLSLKLLKKSYNNVVLPSVKLYHYESLSRGNDLDCSKYDRVKSEVDYMCNKWGKLLLYDKFYNPNLSYSYPFYLSKKADELSEKNI